MTEDQGLVYRSVVDGLRLAASPFHVQREVLPDFVHLPDEVHLAMGAPGPSQGGPEGSPQPCAHALRIASPLPGCAGECRRGRPEVPRTQLPFT